MVCLTEHSLSVKHELSMAPELSRLKRDEVNHVCHFQVDTLDICWTSWLLG